MTAIYPKLLANKSWSKSSIAIRKPYIYAEANTAIVGYIENNYGHIAQVNLAQYEILQPIAQLDKLIDIAVAFDARWSYENGLYKYYTIGEPYIATIDSGNRLYIQYGVDGAKIQLANSATSVKLIRGWKHISVPQDDQGLCALYIKFGTLYSREYIQQADGSYTWTVESQVKTPLGYVKDFWAYRSTDYRLIIIVSDGNVTHMCASTRTWPGTAVPYETIRIKEQITNAKVAVTPIVINTHKTTEAVSLIGAAQGDHSSYTYGTPQNAEAFNEGGHIINLVLANKPIADNLINGLGALSITDSKNIPYSITSAKYVFPYIILEMLDINNAEADITIEYMEGWTKPNGEAIEPFKVTFTPTGLIPVPPDPPIIQSISNVDTEVV